MDRLCIRRIQEVWDPYESCIWPISDPITYEEVYQAIPCAESRVRIPAPGRDFYDPSNRHRHLLRIAWLVTHWEEGHPIQVDVGLGDEGFSVNDGNHRLAAAIYRGHDFIEADVCGSIKRIKHFRGRG